MQTKHTNRRPKAGTSRGQLRAMRCAAALMVLAAAMSSTGSAWADAPQRQAVALQVSPSFRLAVSDVGRLQPQSAVDMLLQETTPAVQCQAVGLYVDGAFVGAVSEGARLQAMLDGLLDSARSQPGVLSASFYARVECRPGLYPQHAVVSDAAMYALMQRSRESSSYTVQAGDSLASISQKTGASQAEILAANPVLANAGPQAGNIIRLRPSLRVLPIAVQRAETRSEAVPFATTEKPSDLVLSGETQLQSPGVPGEKLVSYTVTEVDGLETGRVQVAAQQTKAPVAAVALKGSYPRQSKAGQATGCFLWPTPTLSTITSGYEARWGSFHYGLDIAQPGCTGQPIVAADGGTVAFAGSDNSGYGTHVIIDHGNGFRSYYGHASKVLVQSGQQVAQGQLIALVGNTGRSTGPHCHFEVRHNGAHIDPTALVSADKGRVTPYLGQQVAPIKAQTLAKAAAATLAQSRAAYEKQLV